MELHGTLGTETVGLDEHLPMHSAEPGATYPSAKPWTDFILRFKPAYEAEMRAFLEVVQGTRESPLASRMLLPPSSSPRPVLPPEGSMGR